MTPIPVPPQPDPIEPGYTTTEFWLTTATLVAAAFTDIFHKNVPGGSQAIANGAAGLSTLVYTISRTIRKK